MPNSVDPGRALDGRVAIVTGAGRGIGAAAAGELASIGAQVVVTDIEVDLAASIAAELGASAMAQELDVSREEDWATLMALIEGRFGRLDVLVNNAAVYHPAALAEETVDSFRRIFEINQLGVFLGMRAAAPLMRRSGGGSIINLSSTGGLRGYAGTLAYAGTKWAVRGMTKVAAHELAVDNIRVNSVHPGLSETRMAAENPPELTASLKRSIPAGRLGHPEEIAAAIAFLASPGSSYMTGSELVVDGGATA